MGHKFNPSWIPQPKQALALACPAFELFYGGAAGGGKALGINEKVMTPFGVVQMGDITPGMKVCNPDGSTSTVIYATVPEIREAYRVTMDDGSSVIASDDHLWLYYRSDRKINREIDEKIATTEQLLEILKSGGRRPHIPMSAPVSFQRSYRYEMREIDPYILGLLLGDGSLGSGNIRYSTADEQLAEAFRDAFGLDDFVKDAGINYRLRGKSGAFVKKALDRHGLRVNSEKKHIPEAYKFTTPDNRKAILAGLLDTDGYCDDRGHIEFCSTSQDLAKDVQWIVRSLGGKATITEKPTAGMLAYIVYIRIPCNPFRLKRKADKYILHRVWRSIDSIEPIGKTMVRCIKVDNPNGLFLTNDFIVTHNSDFLLIDFLQGVQFGSKHRGILFRRSYPELEELILRSKELYIPLGATYSESTKTWTFPGGSTIKLRFLESDNDVHKYQGQQFTWIGFDELTNWPTDYVYMYMFSRARTPHKIPVRIRAASNPGGVGHAWVKHRFIEPTSPGSIYNDPVTKLTRCFIPAKLEDNPALMGNDPEYVQRLESLPPHLFRAYRHGDWDIFAGQIFEEFNRDVHVCRPFALDPAWFRFCSMDWGYSRPYSIGWWAVQPLPDNLFRLIRYREMYGCEPGKPNTGLKRGAKDVAEEAWGISVIEGCQDMVADPACWGKSDDSQSIAEQFAAIGWRMERADNSRIPGLIRVHDMLKATAEDGRPLLQVFNTCSAFIRTIPMLVADKRNPEDIDSDGEDHAYDDSRYALMSIMSKRKATEYAARAVTAIRAKQRKKRSWLAA